MRTLFISDLHLTPERPDLAQAFFAFLEQQAAGAASLYILGDFFDYWIGDDLMSPFQTRVAEALAALAAAGTRVFVMHGNRDFLIGADFCRKAGCQLLADPALIELGGQRLLLLHGDSLCAGDTRYLRYRRVVRNSWVQRGFLALPARWREKLAQRLRVGSRSLQPRASDPRADVDPAEVVAVLGAHETSTMIHGHTHKPAVHDLPTGGQRWVLGDWDRLGWWLCHDERGLRLESFSINA